ncbi:myb/SANT-like DNA-binding domain-containing protein 4 [Haliotis cracherodii]|uniref:myb/SANT-like DNA-binding domain-containing protein 4 n=1 Tax=Haliotis cracherodii TaxID=6455 RepID=UPI0039E8DB16
MAETQTSVGVKRVRRSNFSASEIAVLVDEVAVHHATLNSSFSSTVTNKLKGSIWEDIANKINANTASSRSATDVRKKWNDIKCQTRKKAQENRKEACKTGGGPCPATLSEVEQKVLSLIPACQVDGIQGGLETFLSEVSSDTSGVSMPVEPTLADEPVLASLPSEEVITETTVHAGKKCVKRPTQHADQVLTIVDLETNKLSAIRELVSIQQHRCEMERERLALERERLQIEKRRLALEERRFGSLSFDFFPDTTQSPSNCVSPTIKLN